jgi:hypothetical protein
MLLGIADFECDLHIRVEAGEMLRLVVCGGLESNPVETLFKDGAFGQKLAASAVGIGRLLREHEPLILLQARQR